MTGIVVNSRDFQAQQNRILVARRITDDWRNGLPTRAYWSVEERAGSIFGVLLRYLFRVKHGAKVILDPRAGNTRAIRCYVSSE